MDFCYFIGIDIAKDTLDWAVYHAQQGIVLSVHADNTLKSIKQTLAQLKALPGWNSAQAVFCMEHTGIYNTHLLGVTLRVETLRLVGIFPADQAGGRACNGARPIK